MFSKRRRKKRSRGRTGRGFQSTGAVLLLLTMCASLAAVERQQELQERFDKETHASSKVRILDKLGAAQFATAASAAKAEDYSTVGLTFEKYRDNVRTCFDLLMKQEPDAEKHSDAYRRLELQTRRALREVDEMLNLVPLEVQPPLQLVKQDLLSIDDKLIQLLFPRRTKDTGPTPPPPEKKP
ncbi:MAG TPA: hypothetical protein VGF61_01275 [Candidatus Acidoferrum sp.]